MTIFGRRHRSGSSSNHKTRRQEFLRRALRAESLEPRAMMDGSGFNLNRSVYWNINGPNDVNADGRLTAFDALAVINDLNLRGPRSLVNETAGTSASEGPASGGAFVDVNNDNRVTAFDALQVINRLNMSGGEGEPMVRLTVQIVAAGTNDDLTSINKGGFYEMRILTEDLGILSYMGNTRPATFPNGDTFLGVATSFFDVLYDKTKTDVQTNDNQIIFIGGSPTNNGTFTLQVNDGGTLKTTAPITFASNRTVTADNIQVALNTLLKTTPTSPDVVEVVHEPSGGNNRWRVRFINRLGSQDVPEMTGNVSGLGSATITITEDISGEQSNDAAFSDALVLRTRYDQNGNPLNDDGTPAYFDDQRAGSRATFGINDVGGSSLDAILEQRLQGQVPTEIARIRMDATEAGVVNFNLDVINVLSGLETAVNGFFEDPVTTDLIITVGDTLTITEPLSADDETVNLTEGAPATPIDIDVLDGDVNNAPTPNTAKTIQSLNTVGLVGSAQIVTVGTTQMVRYTPPGAASNFNGPTTFTYTVVDQNNNTDTATVTINFAAVNDAPVVSGPTTSIISEDPVAGLVFSQTNGNQITVNDVDNPTNPLSLTITAARGTVTLGSTAGLTGVTGNGGTTITASGSLLDLNAAINGLRFQPDANANSSAGGPFSVTVTVNDNGQTGTGGPLSGSLTNTITVNPVNDAPLINLAGFTVIPDVVEGDPLVLNAANNTLIQVSDIDSSIVTVTLAVSAGNTLHVDPAAGVTIGTNDTNSVTLNGTVSSVNGALANGVTFTAALGAATPETLQITVNDGVAPNVTDSRLIDIDPATRPRARNDVATVAEDFAAGVTIDVLYGPLPDIVNVGATPDLITFDTTSVSGGTVTRDDGGTPADFSDDKLIYVPAPNFFGTDTFTYTMNDDSGLGADSIGTVTVTVTAVNDKPVAQNDPLSSIAEDSGARTILASDLIANDSRGDIGDTNESAQTLTIASVGNAVGGTVSINGSGNVVFTPTANFNGPASFTYTVQDNGQTNGSNDFQTSDPATVSFTITEVNDPPIQIGFTLPNIAEDSGTYVIPIANILALFSPGPANESGQTLTLLLVSVGGSTSGTVAIVGSNVEFTPTPNYNGPATFNVNVRDNGTTNGQPLFESTSGFFTFFITPVNDAPDAQPDTAQTGEGQAINVPVLANDRDVDVNPPTGTAGQLESGTTINIISQTPAPAVSGMVSVFAGNQIGFVPAPGFFGQVVIEYQLDDTRGGLSNITTLTIDVVEANDPPVANPDPGIVTPEDTAVAIDVFANDTDPDTAKANWSFILVTPPTNGTAVFNATTRVVDYTPNANYNGPDSFVYRINDNSPINPQSLLSGTALVSINVTAVNDAPIGGTDPNNTDRTTVIKDQAKTFTVAELLANDLAGPANESGQTLSITGVTANAPNGGTVTLNAGVITYTPAPGFLGDDFFTYTLTDNGTTNGSPAPQSVQVTVNLVVRDFIPTDVNGFVFRDNNNNGTYQVGIDLPISGVAVTLSGISEVSGTITPITVETNHLGFYEFLAVEPGDYHLTQAQPVGLGDGPETLGLAASFFANDDIFLDLPQFGLTGGVSRNDFGEGAIDASKLVNFQGLASESLSSTSPYGAVLATTLAGGLDLWSWKLQGWTNATNMQVTLDADKSAATLVVNGFSTRIFRDVNDVRNPNRGVNFARFRILGWDANGNHIIRLDGTAAEFYGAAHPLAAVAPAAPLSGGEYTDGVDAAMAEENWA